MKANEYNHLIILGNGFDLKCGLHTTYEAFFDERFGIEEAGEVVGTISKSDFRKRLKERLIQQIRERFYSDYFNGTEFIKEIVINTFNENINSVINVALDMDKLNEQKDKLKKTHYTKWDAIFLFALVTLTNKSIVYWNDVERIIYFVITWMLKNYEKVKNSYVDEIMTYEYNEKSNADLYLSFKQLFSDFDFEDLGNQKNKYIKKQVEPNAPRYLRLSRSLCK